MDYSLMNDRVWTIYCGCEWSRFAQAAFSHPSDAADYLCHEAEKGMPDQVVEANNCRARADVFLTRRHFIAWVRIAQGEDPAVVIGRYEDQEKRRLERAAAWAQEEASAAAETL